jgi:Protein of unknown function (DUF3309)
MKMRGDSPFSTPVDAKTRTRPRAYGNQSLVTALVDGPRERRRQLEAEHALRLIILVILILLVIGALPAWPYSAGWGYYPVGGLGTILIILLILALVGVI